MPRRPFPAVKGSAAPPAQRRSQAVFDELEEEDIYDKLEFLLDDSMSKQRKSMYSFGLVLVEFEMKIIC